jgi:3-oxoacyl-[acyl-carrier-protein] synthase III
MLLSKKIFGSTITGIGMYTPERILTNNDLEKMVDTSDEWIVQRTGMKERRILDTDKPMFMMAVEAARNALEDSKVDPLEIGLIIANTTTPDYLNPSLASIVQKEIGAIHAAAFDMNAACSGLPYAIVVAQQFIKTGMYKNVMIIASEALSKIVDWKDRNTCILFGDAAGAVMLSRSNKEDIIASDIGCDGMLGGNITIPCFYSNETDREVRKNGNIQTLWMDGGEVFKFAVTKMTSTIKKVIKSANMLIENIKLIIPHQANMRIIESSIKKLKVSSDMFFVNIEKYGNTSSATIPVALFEAYKQNVIRKGDYIILVGFGAGLTWGSILLRWSKE